MCGVERALGAMCVHVVQTSVIESRDNFRGDSFDLCISVYGLQECVSCSMT